MVCIRWPWTLVWRFRPLHWCDTKGAMHLFPFIGSLGHRVLCCFFSPLHVIIHSQQEHGPPFSASSSNYLLKGSAEESLPCLFTWVCGYWRRQISEVHAPAATERLCEEQEKGSVHQLVSGEAVRGGGSQQKIPCWQNGTKLQTEVRAHL